MATTNTVGVRITGDESDLEKATRQAKRHIDSVADSALSLGKIAGGAALGSILAKGFMKALGVIRQFGKESVQAFDDASASMTKLAAVMTQRGATQQQYDEVLALTEAEEKLGVVSATAMQNGLQELATYVGKAESLKKLTNTMNNLIVQQHGYNSTADQALQTATMMGKVLQGQTGGMERIGYHLDEADEALFKYGTEEERVALLTSIVNENLGNMNHALGQTDTGKHIQLANTWAQLRVQIGELARAVGNVLIPVFSAVANAVGRAIAYVKAFLKIFGIQTGNSANGTAAAVTGAADAVGDYGDAASGAAKKAKKALAAFDEMNVLTEQTDSGSGSGDGGVDILGDLEASAEAINWDTSVLDEAENKIDDLVNKIKAGFKAAFGEWDFEKIGKSIQKFAKQVKKFLKPIGQIANDVWTKYLAPLVTWTGNEFLPAFLNAVSGALEFLGATLGKLWNYVLMPFIDLFLVPIARWTGGIIVTVLNAIGDALSWIANNEAATDVIVGLTAGVAAGVAAFQAYQLVMGVVTAAQLAMNGATVAGTAAHGAYALGVGIVSTAQTAWAAITGVCTGAVTALSAALSLLPFVAIGAAIAALVIGIGNLISRQKNAESETEALGKKVSENTEKWDDNADGILQAAEAMQHWDDVVMQVNNAELKLMSSQEELRKKTEALDEYVKAYGKTQEELTKLYHDNKLETLGLSDDALVKLKKAIIEAEHAEIKMRAAQDEKRKADVAEQEMISAVWQEYNNLGRELVDVAKQHGINSEEYNKAKDAMDEARQKAESYGEANMSIIDWTSAAAAAVEEMGNKTIKAAGRMKGAADILGGDIGDGFIGGIDRKNGAIYYAGFRLGRTAIQGARDGAETHSPSKAAMEIGGWVDEGLAIGLKDNQDLVEKTATGIGNALVSAIDTAPKFRDLGTIEIADQFSKLTARAQGTLDLQNEATTDAIDQLAQAISNLADKDQRVVVQIGEETLYDKIINGINEASRMRNQTVINL